MKKVVLPIPALENPGVPEAMELALEERNKADYRCYMILQRLEEEVGFDILLQKMAEYHDDEEVDEFAKEMRSALRDRRIANERFIGLVAGHEKP